MLWKTSFILFAFFQSPIKKQQYQTESLVKLWTTEFFPCANILYLPKSHKHVWGYYQFCDASGCGSQFSRRWHWHCAFIWLSVDSSIGTTYLYWKSVSQLHIWLAAFVSANKGWFEFIKVSMVFNLIWHDMSYFS